MYMSTTSPIDQVGAFTAFGGDLTHVIVGNMISDDYFENINTKNITPTAGNQLKAIVKYFNLFIISGNLIINI